MLTKAQADMIMEYINKVLPGTELDFGYSIIGMTASTIVEENSGSSGSNGGNSTQGNSKGGYSTDGGSSSNGGS